jgi:hypothetical protein
MSNNYDDDPELEIFDEWPETELTSSYRGVSIRTPGSRRDLLLLVQAINKAEFTAEERHWIREIVIVRYTREDIGEADAALSLYSPEQAQKILEQRAKLGEIHPDSDAEASRQPKLSSLPRSYSCRSRSPIGA